MARRGPRIFLSTVSATAIALAIVACSAQPVPPAERGGDVAGVSDFRTVAHDLGETKVAGMPKRVVALEYSFVQALDELGVTPVGIADDDDPDRIEQLLGETIDYTSVGTRLEPNLELVSNLQPDLIIADTTRHAAIYEQLSSIAPTVVLNSWEGTYDDIKDSVVTIADALGDKAAGEQAVTNHEARMEEIAAEIPNGTDGTFLLIVANPDSAALHTSSAFTGSVFEALGLTPAIESDGEAVESDAGLERLIDVDPDFLFVATDGPGTVFEQWPSTNAWAGMSAVQSGNVYEVDRNQFSRFRGLHTAEVIAEDIVQKLNGDK